MRGPIEDARFPGAHRLQEWLDAPQRPDPRRPVLAWGEAAFWTAMGAVLGMAALAVALGAPAL